MNYLLRTRCTKGHLVVYEGKVSLELNMPGVHNENSLPYSQVTGVDLNTTMAAIPILSKGKATLTIYSKGDQKLEAKLVDLADAKKAKEIIEAKLS